MIVDARAMEDATSLRTDVVIVGGGVAGITMAIEFDRLGIETVLIESGGDGPDAATRDLNRGTSTELPYQFADGCRCRFLGGSSNCWGGWCRPFDALDFEHREWVAHSGWPITLADLAPYYPRTHEHLDLGPYCYDLEAVVTEIARPDVVALPLAPEAVVASVSRFSPPTKLGRKYRATLDAGAHVRTLLHANAVEVVVADGGHGATAVRCRTLAGHDLTVSGRVFVLAAGGIENPRLLLASNRTRPAGIGNDHDLVGRFFMDHPRILSGSVSFRPGWSTNILFDAKFHDRNDAVRARGTHVAAALVLPPDVQAGERVGNARLWFSSMFPGDSTPSADAVVRLIQRRQQKVGPSFPLSRDLATIATHPLAAAGFTFTRRYRPRRLIRAVRMQAIVEPEPDPTSRVTLSPRDRDALGVPRVEVGWKLSPLVRRTFDRTFELVAAELRRCGVAEVALDPPLAGRDDWPSTLNPQGTWHHIGTTRMASSPGAGVVDRDCRVFGLNNLYVAGSSVFPTASANFPTQTICALAIRAAEHLAGRLADGALPPPPAV
jgi:choline dehydrogenase-like flavoprotein